jgi:uncharacterized protein
MASGADGLIIKDRHLLRLRDRLGLPIFEPEALLRLGLI